MSAFDDNTKSFISRHISSVEELETLLLLFREPGSAWTAATVNAELRTSEMSAATKLEALVARGLAARNPDGTFRANTASRDAPLVDKLAAAYREARVSVITHIYQAPKSELKSFTDAFRFKSP